MLNLGTIKPGTTLRIPFSTFDKDDGSSITMTNYAAADILVYKDGNTTERASTAGYTATTDFDGKTGKHLAIIDLADDTTADFFKAGSEYLVAIDAVTVDAITTGGFIARFVIGYPQANLDTSIASLSSQTSFTLTSGPAEDDALNGHWVIIHDKASAVQRATALILDYTGSTKTVTLAAGPTFTIAAGDNVSVMDLAPLQPTTLGRTLDVSSTGEAGLDWANIGAPTTTVNLSGTTVKTATDVETDTQDIQSRLPAALAGGRMDASVGAMAANTMTAAAAAADLTTELQTGLATSTAVATLQTSVDDLPTNAELATALGTADDAVLAQVALVKAKTDNLPTDPADESLIIAATDAIMTRLGAPAGASVSADVAAVASAVATVDGVVDAIKAKTDSLNFTVAGVVDSNVLHVIGAAIQTNGDSATNWGGPP